MKFLGKFFLTVLLLLVLSLVVIYVLLQTQWGAGWFSRYVSDKTCLLYTSDAADEVRRV